MRWDDIWQGFVDQSQCEVLVSVVFCVPDAWTRGLLRQFCIHMAVVVRHTHGNGDGVP